MSSIPYGSVNPTPHKQAKNERRALIVRRHRWMQSKRWAQSVVDAKQVLGIETPDKPE